MGIRMIPHHRPDQPRKTAGAVAHAQRSANRYRAIDRARLCQQKRKRSSHRKANHTDALAFLRQLVESLLDGANPFRPPAVFHVVHRCPVAGQ